MEKRNDRLDLFKALAIYSVVLIHLPLPGPPGQGLAALARFAVPLFFLTSGCFSAGADSRRMVRRALRSCLLFAVCLGLILLFDHLNGTLPPLSRAEVRDLLLWQKTAVPCGHQLWFLAALAAAELAWALLTRLSEVFHRSPPYTLLALFALGALALHLYRGEAGVLAGRGAPAYWYLRNVWLDGLPFYALGAWIGSRRVLLSRLPPALPGAGAALCVPLILYERYLTEPLDLYLGAVLLAPLLLVLSLCRPRIRSSLLRKTLCFCGRRLTLHIYAAHMAVWTVLLRLLPPLGDRPALTTLLTMAASTVLALVLELIFSRGKDLPRLERSHP